VKNWRAKMTTTTATEQPQKWSKDLEQKIHSALRDLRFGTVTLVIQDGKIIQIEKNEKIRI
jgi:hypothetical protein